MKESLEDISREYPPELRERVANEFRFLTQRSEMQERLAEIQNEADFLSQVILSEQEKKERDDATDFYDARVKEMVECTFIHLENYEQSGWKELIFEGDDGDE